MAAKIYTDSEASLDALKGKTCCVIGFGSQGHAHALNLKESGLNVIVGLYPTSKSRAVAEERGFKVLDTAEAVKAADVIMVAVPDTVIPKVYNADIAPNLTEGKTLLFSHGFAIHFKTIVPPTAVDVIMVAPKGPGHLVRRQYTEGKGVPTLIAIYQDKSGKAKDTALAWAKGIGGTRGGVFETTFKEETETDLFGEQVVLCGGLTALCKAGFETLIKAGYQPEVAYFEVLHELLLIIKLMAEGGISYMRYSIANTAEYGDLTRGPRLVTDATRKEMEKILKEIQDGSFAKEWLAECKNGKPNFKRLYEADVNHPIEVVGRKLRKMFSWMEAKEVPQD